MASSASLNLADARALLLSPLGPVARAGSNHNAVNVSFEFFPPNTPEGVAKLRDEEKYADLALLTAAIDNDALQARAFFDRRNGALNATDRI